MDWAKQTQDMFKSWFDVQTKTWEGWFKDIKGDLGKSEPGKAWLDTVDAWQASVKGTLDAQLEGSRILAKSISSIEGAPKEANEWAKQVEEMAKNWSDMQHQLWNNWFEVIKKADPAKFTGGMEEGSDMLKSWQGMAQKAIDTQAEWMRSLSSTAGAKK